MVLRITLLLYTIACIISVSDEDKCRGKALCRPNHITGRILHEEKEEKWWHWGHMSTEPPVRSVPKNPFLHFAEAMSLYIFGWTNQYIICKIISCQYDSYNMSNTIWLIISANAVFIHMVKINVQNILLRLVNLSAHMRFSLGSTGYQQITKFVKMT